MLVKGKKFKVKKSVGKGALNRQLGGKIFIAEGYWRELTGESWVDSRLDNPAVIEFFARNLDKYIDTDVENDVIYGHIDGFGHLFHKSELKKLWWKGKKYYEDN